MHTAGWKKVTLLQLCRQMRNQTLLALNTSVASVKKNKKHFEREKFQLLN